MFDQCNEDCAAIMAEAEGQCQSLWDELHANRPQVVNITGAMAAINLRCRDVRDAARKRCERVREAARSARVKLADAMYDFTY